jgi:hypothetical protein
VLTGRQNIAHGLFQTRLRYLSSVDRDGFSIRTVLAFFLCMVVHSFALGIQVIIRSRRTDGMHDINEK